MCAVRRSSTRDGRGDGLDRDPLSAWPRHVAPLVDGARDPIALDKAVLAALTVETTGAHRLHLAVAHAGQVGADDIAGGLQHALLEEQRLGVEARPPGLAGVGVDRDRRVHAADLGAECGDGASITIGFVAWSEQQVLGRLGLASMPDMQMDEMSLIGGVAVAGERIGADGTVVGGRPDRHATAVGARRRSR